MSAIANRWGFPDLGMGVGLRSPHYDDLLRDDRPVDWIEIISETFMFSRGRHLHVVDQVAERYPMTMHGVSLSIGSTDPLDFDYLKELKALADRLKVRWMGDHVCWTGVAHRNSHDLLPLPYNAETLRHLVSRVKTVQDVIERPLILENASTYVTFKDSTMSESAFLRHLCEEADCGLLLDVNNVYVSCRNHGWDPQAYLDEVPYDRVAQIHVAGHTDKGTYCLDTHSAPVIDPVWEFYEQVHERTGGRSTLLEWDEDIPPFATMLSELDKARACRARVESRQVSSS